MIRKLLAVGVLCLAASVFSMGATSAAPYNDICILDLSQPAADLQALDVADVTCDALAVDVATAAPIGPDDEDIAAGPCITMAHANFDFAGHRQHEDPGRCLI